MTKPPLENPSLRDWVTLQPYLMSLDEDGCEALLKEELEGRKRYAFLRRIHSRINRLRAIRERAEINEVAE